ncbi:MAG: glycoside hydrolase family 15 protein [Deltaproteobacteria bacterium]|nr:glycoside hydrolase family 15 protein [Deltaproteobacteria bacterium]
MPRNLPLGNGSLLVNFDSLYRIRDIYFPHVGKENHAQGHPFRFGIWVDGNFRWIDDPGWVRDLRYGTDTLVTLVSLYHPELEIGIECSDAVDMAVNLLVRRFEVHELSGRPREARLFFHHDFHILENPVGDTAYYEPQRRCLIHYKGMRWFLVNGAKWNGRPPGVVEGGEGNGITGMEVGIDQWATGVKEFQGKEGTWKDAEDGTLEGNPIAQGSVDSTIALHLRTAPNAPAVIHYWMAAGTSFDEVAEINRNVRRRGPDDFLGRTRAYWELWADKSEWDFGGIPAEIAACFRRSLLILRTQIDNGGGITAANDHDITRFARDTYSYVWPRDGALTAYALDLSDHFQATQAFFDFCHRVITKEGYFLHKYNTDGSLASSWHPWQGKDGKQLPIQEDETGLVLWALWKHVDRFRDVEWMKDKYRGLVVRAANWMSDYRDPATGLPLPSYDLWEERYGVHAFTVAAVWAGLVAASRFAYRFNEGHLARKWKGAADAIRAAADRHLYRPEAGRFARTVSPGSGEGGVGADPTLDASLYGLWYFGMYPPDDPRIVRTMEAMRERLWIRTEVGGLARYENDGYFRESGDIERVPGNPWFVCTLWLAQWRIALAKNEEDLKPALDILSWVAARALPSGVLAEQVHPFTGAPLSVSPLTWSHASFVAAFLEYAEKLALMKSCPSCGLSPRLRRSDAVNP